VPRRTVSLLAVVTALLLAGCTPSVRWVAPTAGGKAGASSSAAPGVSPAAWHDCRDKATKALRDEGIQVPLPARFSFDCATIEVPQDWANPHDGKTFHLALIRARSQRQNGRIGSLVVNPGGPGGSGITIAVELALGLPSDVLGRFDIVGFDPRGVKDSDPVKCFSDADLDAMFGYDPDPQSQADFDALVALNKKMADGCQAKYGDSLRLYSTEQAARDVDAVRAAVGDQKLSYLGYSYGTLLGATYAQLFPKNIRAMVLDGAVDPTQRAIPSAESQAKGFARAFDQFASWCQSNSAKCPVASDAKGALASALDRARKSPIKAADGRTVTAGWVATGVFSALYAESQWQPLGQGLADLGKGDPKQILALADEYSRRDANGHYDNMFDIFNTVSCDDDPGGETVAQARDLQSQWRTKYGVFGSSLATGIVMCAVWPTKRDPYPTGKADGAPPIVVVGTVNDPATPYEQTAKLAGMLGVGRVVTWQGEGHTAYPQTTCIRGAVDAYLLNLTVPPDGLTCPSR
jgi:pimeloyl-ACP methyl ester carboxylesterase